MRKILCLLFLMINATSCNGINEDLSTRDAESITNKDIDFVEDLNTKINGIINSSCREDDIRISEQNGITYICIPAGEFLRGSTEEDEDAEDNEFPQKGIYLDAFWISKTEITYAQYAELLNQEGNQEENEVPWFYEDYVYSGLVLDSDEKWIVIEELKDFPVLATWYGGRAFCEWAGGRLPTEAEWEKAARGVDARIFPWGNEFDCSKALTNACSYYFYTEKQNPCYPVGFFGSEGASPYGVFDMAGNAAEWVSDWFDYDYYSIAPSVNPLGPENDPNIHSYKILRGGGQNRSHIWARTASRNPTSPSWNHLGGVRCVISN